LFADLEQLPEPDRENTRRALLDYLNKGGEVQPDAPAPPELQKLRAKGTDDEMQPNRAAPTAEVDRRFYTRRYFLAVAPEDFVERHLETLLSLGKDQERRIKDVLDGPLLSGKRGVNDLIDRPAMDERLNLLRDDLGRWNRLLERIT
ncbi:hypothetical protein C3E98_044475, partial [Pseudomonas sp. MWU13-2625]